MGGDHSGSGKGARWEGKALWSLWWVCRFLFFFGGRTTTLDTHAIDDAARLPAWSFPGGEDMLATHSPRQQMLLSLEDDDMDDGIATSSIKPWLLPSSTSLGAN